MNPSRRILILSDQRLFAEGLRDLLKPRIELEIVGIKAFSQAALAHLKELAPDIVLLADSGDLPPLIATLLDARPGVPVVRLTLRDNEIRIYNVRCLTPQRGEDLAELLRSLPIPGSPSDGKS